MFKYITALFVAFALIACEPREDQAPPPPQDQQPETPAETQQPDQPGQPDQTDPDQTDQTAQVSDDELDAYVEAQVEARDEQIDPMTNREQMEEILEGKDIDYNRFSEIHATVQQNPELQQEVQHRIQEEHGDGFEDPQTEY